MSRASILRPLVVAALVLSCCETANAQTRVVPAGREQQVQALFAPYTLGAEVRDGWRLWSIAIGPREIGVELKREDASVRWRLVPRSAAPTAAVQTESFAVLGDPGNARSATTAVVDAIRRNDHGGFWRENTIPPRATENVVAKWALDGIILCLLGLVVLAALTVRALGEEGPASVRRIAFALVAIVLVGAVLRLGLAPDTLLEAWPYTRVHPMASAIARGPVLAHISSIFGVRVHLQETIFWTNFVCAVLTPVAVFLQVRVLHRDTLTALVAAGLLAVLPDHIRFSRSDTAFIASLLMSCIADLLVHVASEDRSRRWRWAATALLPPLIFAMLQMRPLNTLFGALFIAHALFLVRRDVPRARRAVIVAIIAATGVVSAVTYLFAKFSPQIHDALTLDVLIGAVGAFFTTRYNTLIHPWITPPLLTALAIAGAIWLWRRPATPTSDGAPGWARSAYLIAWLLAFFLTHAFVSPKQIAMQARYHLHILLPFIYLAAPALVALHARVPRLAYLAAGVLALSPLFHLDFIRDVDFDPTHEHAFLRDLRERVPAGCTVVEYIGPRAPRHDPRMPRVGRTLEAGAWGNPWRTSAVRNGPSAIAALTRGDRCTVWIQSLLCFSLKHPEEPIAPACADVRRAVQFRTLAERRFQHRNYDEVLSEGLDDAPDQWVTLAALRVIHAPRTAPGS